MAGPGILAAFKHQEDRLLLGVGGGTPHTLGSVACLAPSLTTGGSAIGCPSCLSAWLVVTAPSPQCSGQGGGPWHWVVSSNCL